jgi:outer membrane lipoprotein SlyB
MKYAMLSALAVGALLGGGAVWAARVGQSATVQFGTVRGAQSVRLDSDAGKGALIGGTLGLVAGGIGGGRRPVMNGLLGAAIGGIGTAAVQGNRTAMAYTVELADGSMTRIVTDQREIRLGDCVAVERVGQTANIRRESVHYCQRGYQTAVGAVRKASVGEAVQCERAKEELVSAKTSADADLASRKIALLCDG